MHIYYNKYYNQEARGDCCILIQIWCKTIICDGFFFIDWQVDPHGAMDDVFRPLWWGRAAGVVNQAAVVKGYGFFTTPGSHLITHQRHHSHTRTHTWLSERIQLSHVIKMNLCLQMTDEVCGVELYSLLWTFLGVLCGSYSLCFIVDHVSRLKSGKYSGFNYNDTVDINDMNLMSLRLELHLNVLAMKVNSNLLPLKWFWIFFFMEQRWIGNYVICRIIKIKVNDCGFFSLKMR